MKLIHFLLLLALMIIISCSPVTDNTVTSSNEIPIAIFQVDSIVPTRAKVILDGSLSYDPDSSELTYVWGFISAPGNSQAQFEKTGPVIGSPNNSFIPDKDGQYGITLYTYNETDTSNIDTVYITSQNFPPVISLFKVTSPHGTVAYEKVNQTFHFAVSDPNNDYNEITYYLDPYGNGQYIEEFVIDSGFSTHEYAFLDAGMYQPRVIIDDQHGGQDTAYMKDTIEIQDNSPVAKIKADPLVPTRVSVQLDASLSYKPDSSELTYVWGFISAPGNSQAQFEKTGTVIGSPNNSFIPDLDGQYIIQLFVHDQFDTSESVVDTIIAEDLSPVIENWSFDTTIISGNKATFTWTAFDPNGDSIISIIDYFGDGTVVDTTTASSIQYQYMSGGVFLPTLTVLDNKGNSASIDSVIMVSSSTIDVPSPHEGDSIADSTYIRVDVYSNYDIQSVTATVEDSVYTIPIAYQGASIYDCYLYLQSHMGGVLPILITVTDVLGNSQMYIRKVINEAPNLPPRLVFEIQSPRIANPQLQVKAKIIDENPETCKVQNWISPQTGVIRDGYYENTIDLSEFTGSRKKVDFRITDEEGYYRDFSLNVDVLNSPHMSIEDRVEGAIISVNKNFILFREVEFRGSSTEYYKNNNYYIYDRKSGEVDTIAYGIRSSWLHPNGILFWSSDTLYNWNDGSLSVVGTENGLWEDRDDHIGSLSISENRNFISYSRRGIIYRMNVLTGTTTRIDSSSEHYSCVTDNGVVIFNANPTDTNFVKEIRISNGISIHKTYNLPAVVFGLPDGVQPIKGNETNFLMALSQNSYKYLGYIDNDTLVELSNSDPYHPFLVQDDIIAFTTKKEDNIQSQIWTQTLPGGILEQRTGWASSSTLQVLSEDGTFTYVKDNTLILNTGGINSIELCPEAHGESYNRHIIGKSYNINNEWYFSLGSALVKVNN